MSANQPIVTRFAPSPTGMLHIGGARTALFNWVFARRHHGKFLLRIEDTDRARSTEAACAAIIDGLTWLGIEWDDEPVFQFSRASRHAQIADMLVSAGNAYRDYSSDEERQAAAEALKRGERSVSRWRDAGPSEWPDDVPFVVRLKAPQDGETVIEDAVQGRVVFRNSELDDLVLLRSDGTPTYMLAVVVDDHDMGVTHVIRGDDHLTNAARQSLIWKAAGWTVPVFAHIPLIHGDDGKKLSKRHGAVGAEEFRDAGYIPEALRNYLLRLGWAHGDMELFTDAEAREVFDLDGISRGAAQLDYAKLDAVNTWHLRRLSPSELARRARPWLTKTYGESVPGEDELAALIGPLQERFSRLADAPEQLRFVFQERPLDYSGKTGKALRNVDETVFRAAIQALSLIPEERFTAADIQTSLTEVCAQANVGFGSIGAPLRAALCAGAPAPDLSLTIALIGKSETLLRLNDALTEISASRSQS